VNADGLRQLEVTDLSVIDLTVLMANDEELSAHDAVLMQLDKASGGKTVWRQTAAA
jgi:DNA polymerase III subunit epsilon